MEATQEATMKGYTGGCYIECYTGDYRGEQEDSCCV